MSETGATVYVLMTSNKHGDQFEGVFSTEAEANAHLATLTDWRHGHSVDAHMLDGYQIVPPGSIVLTEDEADIAHFCVVRCINWSDETVRARRNAGMAVYASEEADRSARYRALAAKLGGER